MKLNRRDLCYAEGEPDRNSFLFCWRAFPTRSLRIQPRSMPRAYTYSRMLHLLAARFPFVFFSSIFLTFAFLARLWLVDNAHDLQALAKRCKRLEKMRCRDFVPFTGTRLSILFFHNA